MKISNTVLLILLFFLMLSINSWGSGLPGFETYRVKKYDTIDKITDYPILFKQVNRVDEFHLPLGKKVFVPRNIDIAKEYCPVPKILDYYFPTPRAIIFYLDIQYFAAYDHGELILWGPISSGKKGKKTPLGEFFIDYKRVDYISTNFLCPMRYAVRFDAIIGLFFHQQAMPGFPASHGCLRMLEIDAQWLYFWIQHGDLVKITNCRS